MPKFYSANFAKAHMIATDYLPADEWLAHVERLSPEQINKEMLRQATDTKLQLISVLNALHVTLLVVSLLLGVLIWRVW
jgi:hypothetical protein